MSPELILVSVILVIALALALVVCGVLLFKRKNSNALRVITCVLIVAILAVSIFSMVSFYLSDRKIETAQNKSIFKPTSVNEYIEKAIEQEKNYFSEIIDFEQEKDLIEIGVFSLAYNRMNESNYLQFGTAVTPSGEDAEFRMMFDVAQNNKLMTEKLPSISGSQNITINEFKIAMSKLEEINFLALSKVEESGEIDLLYGGVGSIDERTRANKAVVFIVEGESVVRLAEMDDEQFSKLAGDKFYMFSVIAKEARAMFYFEIQSLN